MHRALIKILVGLAVALGLTLTSTPVAQAAPAVVAERASSSAAASCAAEQAGLARAKQNHGRAVRAARHARNALAKAKRAEAKAETRKARKAKHKVVVRATKRLKKARAKRARKARAVKAHRAVVARCQTSTPGQPTRISQSSPIQALCDAGVPSEVCDVLGGLLGGLVPAGTNPLAVPLGQLCSLAPEAKPLCDLLSGQTPDLAAFESILSDLAAQLDPTLVEAALTGLLGQLGLADLLDPSSLGLIQDVLDTVLGELGLGGLLDDILDGIGLGHLLG